MNRISLSVVFLLMLFACGPDKSLLFISLPGGDPGIGFDDMRYSPMLNKVIVPGGKTGFLFLIDPSTRSVSTIGDFRTQAEPGKVSKVTSVDEGEGYLFVTDVILQKLYVVDPVAGKILESVNLAGDSDFVRYVALTGEVWVTEGDDDQVEVFRFSKNGRPMLQHAGFVSVPDGPEGLVIDNPHNVAYSNVWTEDTVAIDIKARKIVRKWKSTCKGPRGVAFDPDSNFLFVGCEEGKAVSMDTNQGAKVLDSVSSGKDVDIIAYDPQHRRVYLPGAHSGTMAQISVSPSGDLSIMRKIRTIKGAHCAVTDNLGNVYVCDPDHARILVLPFS